MAFVPSRARKTAAKSDAKPEIVDQIGQHLGKVYNDILKQPVPDRFLDLLRSLEAGAPPKLDPGLRSADKSGARGELEVSTAGARKKDAK
ncbi:MAG TPA: NepR family anti-sigma factor [Methylovirgula sp.]